VPPLGQVANDTRFERISAMVGGDSEFHISIQLSHQVVK
jgi:hypothetical protein